MLLWLCLIYVRIGRSRPRSHGNTFIPIYLHSSVLNAKLGCSHGNAIISYRFLFLLIREGNRSALQIFSLFCPFLLATTTPTHALWAKSYRPDFWPVLHFIAGTHGNRAEWMHTVPRFISLSYRSTWNKMVLFEVFPFELNQWAFFFSEQNYINGTIAFPCEHA